jgi:Flp pilus assembly protein TadG
MSRTDREPRGVTIILVVVVLAVIGGFMALALNVGHLMMVRGQLQNGADAAALAAARDLNGTQAGIDTARATAKDFAGRHSTDASNRIVIADADIVFGNWNYDRRTFNAAETDPSRINAVRVHTGRESSDLNAVPVHARFLPGPAQVDVTAEAIAAAGVPCTADCPVPFALPDCELEDADGKINCDAKRTFKNDLDDNICFTNLTDMTVGDPPDPVTGEGGNPDQPAGTAPTPPCNGGAGNECASSIITSATCAPVEKGDEIKLANGNDANSKVAEALQALIQAKTGDPWAELEVIAPVIYTPDCSTGLKCNQTGYVRGFAKFTVKVVQNDNPLKPLLIEFGHQCWEYSGGSSGNCSYFGTSTTQDARLVR